MLGEIIEPTHPSRFGQQCAWSIAAGQYTRSDMSDQVRHGAIRKRRNFEIFTALASQRLRSLEAVSPTVAKELKSSLAPEITGTDCASQLQSLIAEKW